MKESFKKIKWILSQAKPVIPMLIISVSISAIMSAVGVYNALLSKSLIDSAISGNTQMVIKWLTVMGGIMIFNMLIGPVNSLLSTYCSTKISNNLQNKFFTHITYCEWMEHSKHHSVSLLTRITGDVGTINGIIMGTLTSIITSLVTLTIAFFSLLKLAPQLAIFAIFLFPSLMIVNKLFGKKLKKFYVESQELSIKYRSFIQESMQNIMIVKTFCREKYVIDTIKDIQKDTFKLAIKRVKLSSLSGICFQLGASGTYFVAYCIGALSIAAGTMTFGTLTALLQLFNRIQGPLSSLAGCYSPIIAAFAAAERLMEIEDMVLEKDNEINTDEIQNPLISFNNVSFGYKENSPVLKDISFDIQPGETIALIGPSGQGKTTIIRMLLSLIHANEGTVTISDDEICDEINKNHRKLISYIPQGNTLFSGTITDNICYGNDTASEEDIIEATKLACAYDFIQDLDDKFDTTLGERGLGVSEGQAQRLAIARAFLRKRPILILDEATSALDGQTEVDILKAVKNLEHKPTCIIITHRPSALAICDRVLRMEEGYLLEEDSNFAMEIATSLA